jgi:uncharacterized membrane protein (GlpM family)
LTTFLWKAILIALVVLAIIRLARRVGPLVASAVMTLPLSAGPGFFFLAFEQSESFVRDGALFSLAATGPVVVFTTILVRALGRLSFAPSLAIASIAWLAIAYVLLNVDLTMISALAIIGAGGLFAAALSPRLDAAGPLEEPAHEWRLTILRAATAGLAVAAVSVLGGRLGPELSGLALGFPITITAASWAIAAVHGRALTRHVLNAAKLTITSYAVFCLVLHLAVGPLAPVAAWTLASAAALICAFAIAATGLRRSVEK